MKKCILSWHLSMNILYIRKSSHMLNSGPCCERPPLSSPESGDKKHVVSQRMDDSYVTWMTNLCESHAVLLEPIISFTKKQYIHA